MREKFLIFGGLIILLIALIGLNAASYTQQETMPDDEMEPNRSSYNTGATGTRAFYELLSETGHKTVRWQETPSNLNDSRGNKPSTFVVIGRTRREFTDVEISNLLRWVRAGGKLVIIDREPPVALIAATENWNIKTIPAYQPPFFNTNPSDQKQMTFETEAAKPVQPTIYTKDVNGVQPSRYASTVSFERLTEAGEKSDAPGFSGAPPLAGEPAAVEPGETEPPKTITESSSGDAGFGDSSNKQIFEAEPEPQSEEPIRLKAQIAPVLHLANNEKNLLADFPFGAGKIVFLTDPYIISNGGINLIDNAQLSINIVASRGGIIAFDEYHQGFGANENRLLSYFSGTPVIAFLIQIAALIGLIFYSQSRRFTRPLPSGEPNRLSKLEYVAAMAELQRRTKGFDLALENIYHDFRRRVSRLIGVDSRATKLNDLSHLIAQRLNASQPEIHELLQKCEDIAHGETTNKKEVLQLVKRLRDLEENLGLKRSRSRIFGK